MSNRASAPARANEFAHQIHDSAANVRESIQDAGDSVGHMATRQYKRTHDTVTSALKETSSAVQRNPLLAIGTGLRVGIVFGLAVRGRNTPVASRGWW